MTLQNTAIENPERIFDVELVLLGPAKRNTITRVIKVSAQTPRGAKRICKQRYHQSEIHSTRVLAPVLVDEDWRRCRG